jgi:general secretion pathway protein C
VEPAAISGVEVVDIDRMRAWHLFGEAGAVSSAPVVEETAAPTAREGIEKGARETRLDLKLRGVVASSEDGLGHAIIEYKSKQAVYAVEDKLPLSGQVVLAKVMPTQVVLDNGGTYELLQLFEDSALDTQLASPPAQTLGRRPATADAAVVDRRTDEGASALARSYRERLYQNPQSLAEVVTISAVRENGDLLGYRIAPGKDQKQFEQLGFKPGDLVIGINGIALDDPANTVRLYQTMRTASEAVFELQRDEQPLTVSVSLDSGSGQGR